MKFKEIIAVVLILLMTVSAAFAEASDKERKEASDEMMQEIKKKGAVTTPSPGSRESKIFNSIVKHTKRKNIKYRLKIVEDKDVNAHATPDGQIVFTTGLLKALPKNDSSMTAFIAAHEISHVEQKHGEKKFRNALITGGALLFLAGRSKNLTKILAGVAYGLINSGYSRGVETDADKGAFELMKKSGYDPNGALRVFKMFMELEKKNKNKGPRVFPSHPLSKDRYNNCIKWMEENNVKVREP